MAERIATVLERRADEPGRFEALARLLDDPQNRIELEDYLEAAIRRESGAVAARMYAHARFYAELVRREGERLKGPEQPEAMQILEHELSSILAAAKRALDQEAGDLPLTFSIYIQEYLEKSGRWNEALALYDRMIDSARRIQRNDYLLSALLGYSSLSFGVSRFSEAQSAALEARSLAHAVGDEQSEALAINWLGNIACQLGNYDEAIRLHEQSLAMRRKIGKPHLVAASLHNLATACAAYGLTDRAAELYEESLAINRTTGNRQGMSITLNNLGNLARNQERFADARKYYQECLETSSELGDHHGRAAAIGNLGSLAYVERDLSKAESLVQEALRSHRRIDDRQGIAESLCNLGGIALCQRRLDRAKELLTESLTSFEDTGERLNVASVKALLAVVSIFKGDFSGALGLLSSSLQVERELLPPNDPERMSIIAASAPLLSLGRLQQAAVLNYGIRHQYEQKGRSLGPVARDCLDDGIARLDETLPEAQLAQLKAQAESMSLEELAEYALKALEEVRAELGSAEPGEPDTAGQAIPAPAAGQSAIAQDADGK